MNEVPKSIQIEEYEKFVGAEMVERVRRKAERLQNERVVHINSTKDGGGVAELLSSLTLLMNNAGIETEWRVLVGHPDFFAITKAMHNALQGSDIPLSDLDKQLYEQVAYENSIRNRLDFSRVIVHDPQPLPLINLYQRQGPWIWQCHIDLTKPNPKVWDYLSRFVNQYDTAVFSLEEYAQPLQVPQYFMMPAIDPFALKNKEMSEQEAQDCLDNYGIPTDLPLVVQISRFDPWKDPSGVIEAFKLACEHVDATLVLAGNFASDDPEGSEIYHSLLKHSNERIRLLTEQDSTLVNALQRRAAVVVQKSLREGFGLTVSEAMWKGTPVIGGNVGGIPQQIEDGVNGFLVSSVPETAERIIELLQHPERRAEMGRQARETVRRQFLMIRLLEQYLDLLYAAGSQDNLQAHIHSPPRKQPVT